MTTAHRSDAECVAVLKAIREHGSQHKAGIALGMAQSNVSAIREIATSRGLTADTVIKDPLHSAELKIKRLTLELAAVKREADTAESIRRTIYELADVSPEPPTWLTSAKFSGTPGCPMTMWSDWHYGEVVRKGEVGGANEFNRKIAKERIRRLVDRTIRLTKGFAFKERSGAAKFPGIVVCLGGDMISGDIHEELAETNDGTPLECVNELLDLLIAAIGKLADEFGAVFVPCVVGNHGRTTRKPRAKGRVFTSYEWNLYTSLERHFRYDKRVNVYVPGETDAYFTVAGHRFLLTHGDSLGVRGGDGIIGALGPIMRGRIKVGASECEIGRDFDTMVIGHWHQELWLPGVIVNNCLKGYDEYARLFLRAPFSRPSQNLWFIHEQQGITARLGVYVDDVPKRLQKAADWVIVPGRR